MKDQALMSMLCKEEDSVGTITVIFAWQERGIDRSGTGFDFTGIIMGSHVTKVSSRMVSSTDKASSFTRVQMERFELTMRVNSLTVVGMDTAKDTETTGRYGTRGTLIMVNGMDRENCSTTTGSQNMKAGFTWVTGMDMAKSTGLMALSSTKVDMIWETGKVREHSMRQMVPL